MVPNHLGHIKQIWYLSPLRAAKVQVSLRICAVSPEPPLLAQTSSESRGTFRQKARSLAPLNGWACAVKICHDGMLEDTNSLDGAHSETSIRQTHPVKHFNTFSTVFHVIHVPFKIKIVMPSNVLLRSGGNAVLSRGLNDRLRKCSNGMCCIM